MRGEHRDRAFGHRIAEFLDAGIPAVDLIDFEYPWKDTLQDSVDKVSARSLDVVGETVIELLLRERRR